VDRHWFAKSIDKKSVPLSVGGRTLLTPPEIADALLQMVGVVADSRNESSLGWYSLLTFNRILAKWVGSNLRDPVVVRQNSDLPSNQADEGRLRVD
jgi:hypothetical protein